jgi:hypothetical protein
MEGLLLVAECIGIGLILFWIMKNNAAGPGDRTSGLLAMRSEMPRDKAESDPQPGLRPARRERERAKRR